MLGKTNLFINYYENQVIFLEEDITESQLYIGDGRKGK